MNTSDLATLSPFIAAILVAAAILMIDFVFPGRRFTTPVRKVD